MNVRVWLTKGGVQELRRREDAGKIGEIKIETDSQTLRPYFEADSHSDLLGMVPKRYVRKVTVMASIQKGHSGASLAEGIYDLGDSDSITVTHRHCTGSMQGIVYVDLFIEAKTVPAALQHYSDLREGKLQPSTAWSR